MIAYGTFETPEFQRQSRDFAAALKAAGKSVELIEAPDYNHFEMCESLGNPFGPNGGFAPHPKLSSVRVVGIVASPGNFPAVGISSFFSVIYVTPAFAHANHVTPNPPDSSLIIRLRRGSADLDTFSREMTKAGLGAVDVPIIEKVQTVGIQKSMRFESQALWAMAALIGLVALAILSQALARQTYLDSVELPTLRAIGMSRRQLFGLGISRATGIGLVAAVASVLVAILLSPLTPVGLARLAEPHPGVWIDGLVLMTGAALVSLLTVAASALPALTAARSSAGSSNHESRRGHRSMLAGVLDFHHKKARDVMRPRTEVVALDIDSSEDEVRRIVKEERYSRYPVIRYAGQPIAGVAATSQQIANDAAALVKVQYDTLPFVVDRSAARS